VLERTKINRKMTRNDFCTSISYRKLAEYVSILKKKNLTIGVLYPIIGLYYLLLFRGYVRATFYLLPSGIWLSVYEKISVLCELLSNISLGGKAGPKQSLLGEQQLPLHFN